MNRQFIVNCWPVKLTFDACANKCGIDHIGKFIHYIRDRNRPQMFIKKGLKLTKNLSEFYNIDKFIRNILYHGSTISILC